MDNMKLIILGPQASGKGTQADLLSQVFGVKHVSMGDCLRQEVAARSRIGLKVKELMDRGELVSDELTNKIAKKATDDAQGKFILDGYPRTLEQVKYVEDNIHIDKVIVLTISEKTAIERMGGRRQCQNGHTFHIKFHPPKKEGICDECGLPLKQRSDDTTVAIMKRLQNYREQTKPVIEYYSKQHNVITINGEPPIKEVHQAIVKALHH
jgi:adenylate kinase